MPDASATDTDSEGGTQAASIKVETLADDECARIMAALEAKRQEVAEDMAGDGDTESFYIVVTGGPWCRANLGCDYDGVKARARGGMPERWCRSRGLPLSSSFTVRLYGEHGAAALAQAWVHKLHRIFHLAGGDEAFVYTDEHVQAYLESPALLEFVRGLPAKDKAHQKVQHIRALRPSSRVR